MRYEVSDRVQFETYCCNECFISDVMETLFNCSLHIDQVHIITDKYKTEELIKLLSVITINDFEFSFSLIDFNICEDMVDEYRITILNNGEIYIESAIDKDANYYDCDGFMFVDEGISIDSYNGSNKHCNVMVFEIES